MCDANTAGRIFFLTPDTRNLNTAGKDNHPPHSSLRAIGSTSRKPGWTKAGPFGPGSLLDGPNRAIYPITPRCPLPGRRFPWEDPIGVGPLGRLSPNSVHLPPAWPIIHGGYSIGRVSATGHVWLLEMRKFWYGSGYYHFVHRSPELKSGTMGCFPGFESQFGNSNYGRCGTPGRRSTFQRLLPG